jgi:hypothetical protein
MNSYLEREIGPRQPNVMNEEQYDKLVEVSYSLMDGLSKGDRIRLVMYQWTDEGIVEREREGTFQGLFVNYWNGLGLEFLDNSGSRVSLTGTSILRLEKL